MNEADMETFENRVKNLTREEQEVTAKHIDYDILLSEIQNRFTKMENKISLIEKAIK